MKRLAAALLALSPGIAEAGNFCTAPQPTVMPSCTVGVWAGTNDMLDKMRAVMASMPATVRANMEANMTQPLGMMIFEDGYYATMPVNRGMGLQLQGALW